MDQCFRHANMHFKRLPLEHTDHPFNSEDGVRQLLQRADQSPGVIPSAAIPNLNISSAARHKLILPLLGRLAWTGGRLVAKGVKRARSRSRSREDENDLVRDVVRDEARDRAEEFLQELWSEYGTGLWQTVTGLVEERGVAAEFRRGNPVVLDGSKELDLLAMNWNTLSRSVQSPVLPWMSSIALRAVCNNCYAHMAAGIQFNMVIRGMSSPPFVYVDSMLLKVYGSLAMNMDVAVSSMGRASVSSRPLTLVPDRQVATITLPVAFIPVQISFAVGLKVSKITCSWLMTRKPSSSQIMWASALAAS
ncbi:hypothetical protein HaLaN_16886 [Haematococcus lacustris]|uniref:Uncharacterized protein n=1 Tax=Haematococcus lacustris TaxID=44745 RepID=A0A699ZB62_HAELA|nr:hypothetical protein HaLaN_16886 [Haematococcus lacustris]